MATRKPRRIARKYFGREDATELPERRVGSLTSTDFVLGLQAGTSNTNQLTQGEPRDRMSRTRRLRKFMVVKAFTEILPQRSDFKIAEEQILKLSPKEFLVKADYISVDPYMRSIADEYSVPYEQFGFQIGKVIESRNDKYPVDAYVVSHSGWRDHVTLDGSPDEIFGIHPYIPELGKLPPSFALGVLGMTGRTAYLGLLEVCKPKAGETLCVTSASGAVGSVVGQIGRILGCIVIGLTGSDWKVKILKKELEFQHAINYKTENVSERLKKVAPNGIDCFFDNVGGSLAAIIIKQMNEYGRIANCGSVSTHGQESIPRPPKAGVSVRIEAFSLEQWDQSKQLAAAKQLKAWIEQGAIKAKQTINNDFQELPNTLIAMLKGDTIGKALVRI